MRRAGLILCALVCVVLLGSLSSGASWASPTAPDPTSEPDDPDSSSPSEVPPLEASDLPTVTVTADPTETATVVAEPTETATVVVTEPAEPVEPPPAPCGSPEDPCTTVLETSSADDDFRLAMGTAAGLCVVFLAILAVTSARRR